MKDILKVTSLHKRYGSLNAVDGIEFNVKKGEIFGILGPNGAGKTTSLECILGIKQRDEGEISLLGMSPDRERKILYRKVGVQFQDSSWQTGIRVGEICEVTASLYDIYNDWSDELEKIDLLKRKNNAVDSLSGGEKQKLSIFLACIHKPELVFLDELTTGLDPIARRATWDFIRKMKSEGTTFVLTSHFMDEVEFLCDRGLIMKDGKIISQGSIDEIKADGRGDSLEDAYINLVSGENKQ